MQPSAVEFRQLRLLVNPVTGESVTVVLAYFDGARLRLARVPSLGRVPEPLRHHVDRGLEVIEKRAQPLSGGALALSLDELFPTREGLGTGLSWGPLQRGQTAWPDAHFEQLRALMGLDVREARTGLSAKQVGRDLRRLAVRLQSQYGERIEHDRPVVSVYEHVSPLSWRVRDRWEHTYVVGLHAAKDAKAVAAHLIKLAGQLRMTLPADDAAVIVAIPPAHPSLLEPFEQFQRELVIPQPRYTTVELEDESLDPVEGHVTQRLAA